MKKRSKYGVRNDAVGIRKRTGNDGKVYDSATECQYGQFIGQVVSMYASQHKIELQASLCTKYGKLLPICYVADFVIGNIVIDVKGMETAEFKLKKKLLAVARPDLTLILARKRRGMWEHYLYRFPTAKSKVRPMTLQDVVEKYS
jgi:hypothetical protein